MCLNGKKILKIFYKNQERIITIDESRHTYSNKAYNISIIELKDGEFPFEIFLMLDNSINTTGQEEILNAQYLNQDIYLINFYDGNEPEYLCDKIKEIRDFLLINYCNDENILLGSPILNLNNFKVIGIHKGINKEENSNIGSIIRVPVNEYNKSKEASAKQNAELLNIMKKPDEPKSIIELLSQKFLKDKEDLENKLNEYLTLSELTDDYKNEVAKKFKTKITKVFDTKTDTNTLLNLLSKIKGLPNLVAYIYIGDKTEKENMNQLCYVNGKIDLVDNTFTFENSDVFSYGNYKIDKDDEYGFISFRPQNTQLYLKIKFDCIYIMCYREGVGIKLLLKIKQNFKDNPILSLSGKGIKLCSGEGADEGEEEFSEENILKAKNDKVNIDEIFEKQKQFQSTYLKELVIYKIDD